MWTSQEASNNEQDHTPSTFARRVSLECENYRVRLKGVLVERDSEVRVASVRHELIGDERNMITGFLKNNRMEFSTGSGDNVGRISARRAWIPLKKGKREVMMHEITVSCINTTVPFRFVLTLMDQRKNEGTRLGKKTSACTVICINRIVGSRQSSTSTSLSSSS